jgi:hypothetical protein
LRAGGSAGTNTLTITTDAGETLTKTLPVGVTPVTTGFTKPASVLTVTYTGGWTIELDDIMYSTAAVPPPPPTITSVTVTCIPTSFQTGGTSTCSAAVVGTRSFNNAVTWSAVGGAVGASGVFTSSAPGAAQVTATSVQDTTKTGSFSITVTAPPPPTINGVSVACLPATVATGVASTCTALVAGTGAFNPAVTWAVDIGTISAAGVFTGSVAGVATVTAASVRDATKTAVFAVTVTLPPVLCRAKFLFDDGTPFVGSVEVTQIVTGQADKVLGTFVVGATGKVSASLPLDATQRYHALVLNPTGLVIAEFRTLAITQAQGSAAMALIPQYEVDVIVAKADNTIKDVLPVLMP